MEISEFLERFRMYQRSGDRVFRIDMSKIDFREANMPGEYLEGINLASRNLTRANLEGAYLGKANLFCATLAEANLSKADLNNANLSWSRIGYANLEGADLSNATFQQSDLLNANLRNAHLENTNLQGANLCGADLTGAFIENVLLDDAKLWGIKGLVDPVKWMRENFDKDNKGWIVYKFCGNSYYCPPPSWKFEEGRYLEETVNPLRTLPCGSGVNFATLDWIQCRCKNMEGIIWECRIRWVDSCSIVAPYSASEIGRCEKLLLVKPAIWHAH